MSSFWEEYSSDRIVKVIKHVCFHFCLFELVMNFKNVKNINFKEL
jgi:hypothetical protein